MFCHSYAHCFTIEPWVYSSAVLKQNGNEKYLLSCSGENLMAKLYVCFFTLCLFSSSWISLILNELKKFRSPSMHDYKKKNWKIVIKADLKSFPQRKTTKVMKFSVSYKHWVNEIFRTKKYFTCNNSIKCKSLLNSSIQCNLFPRLLQPLQRAGGKGWTLHLATEGTKTFQTVGPVQDSENTA